MNIMITLLFIYITLNECFCKWLNLTLNDNDPIATKAKNAAAAIYAP